MTIDYDLDGPVAVVTINRLEVANAIDRANAAAQQHRWRKRDGSTRSGRRNWRLRKRRRLLRLGGRRMLVLVRLRRLCLLDSGRRGGRQDRR